MVLCEIVHGARQEGSSALREKAIEALRKARRDSADMMGKAQEIAREFGLSESEVYSIATFYHFLGMQPEGTHIIRVCKSVPCHFKESVKILDALKKELAIEEGETTPDKKFSLEVVNCIGACDISPAIMIDEKVYGNLTAEKVTALLAEFRAADEEGEAKKCRSNR
jgi:NADH:ubiquinone oxidoreductase subunit E